MARPLVRDEEGVSTLVSLIGVLILVIAILAVYFGFLVPKFAGPPLRARSGDGILPGSRWRSRASGAGRS